MSKSYFEEPRRGPIALEPWRDPYSTRGTEIPPSGPADPRQRVRNDRREPEPYRDLRLEPNLTGTWFERRGRYRLFINHVGAHLECLLTLVVHEHKYHTEKKSLAADVRLPLDWGIVGYSDYDRPESKRESIAFRFAGDWSVHRYFLSVPRWLGEHPSAPPEGLELVYELGHMGLRDGGDELDIEFTGWFVRRWPEVAKSFGVKEPGEGEPPADLKTVAVRASSQPVLLDRYLARPSVPYHVRTHYWFPLTPKQRKNLLELARSMRYEQVFVDPERNYKLTRQAYGGKAMDVYDLLKAGRSLGRGLDASIGRQNIVTALDRIVERVFERARDTLPYEGGLGADELVHLRPYVLRFLEEWCLETTEDHGSQTLTTALQRLVDETDLEGAEHSHLEKYLGITSRGWRGFRYDVEVTAFELLDFTDEETKKKLGAGGKAFEKLEEVLEEKLGGKLPTIGKFKRIAKYLPVAYLVGHVRVRYVGVVEGDTGGPQDEPWEAHYGFALGGISLSKSLGSVEQSVKMSGSTIIRASTPPMKEELEGVLGYIEGDLFAGVGLGSEGDKVDKGERNDGIALTRSMLTFYGREPAPAVAFVFGARLSGGIGGVAVGGQGLVGAAWLLDGGESRIVIEPKGKAEEQEFQSYWQDRVPSLAVHFPINGARLPVPTEAEQERMREQGTISVKEALDAFAACELPLIANPAARIEIDGFADAPGKSEDNLVLSENRARSICNYLNSILGEHFTGGMSIEESTKAGRLFIEGHGEPPKGAKAKPGAKEEFDPIERRADIKISLGAGAKESDGSLEWRLRRGVE